MLSVFFASPRLLAVPLMLLIGLPCLPASHAQDSARTLRQVYRAEVGVQEATGRNDGPRVEAYLSYAGFGPGAPWCAAFVAWCHGQAGLTTCRSAWSPAWFPPSRTVWLRASGQHYAWRSGDVFGIHYQHLGRVGHVGFVDSVAGHVIFTVEGNTNAQGSREGQGVWRKRRPLRTIWGVSRWSTR